MITGTTKSGFSFEIPEEAKDDMELLEGLINIDKGDLRSIPTVLILLLGAEQKKALYEHCRDNGRVSSKKVLTELTEIFNATKSGESEVKNL